MREWPQRGARRRSPRATPLPFGRLLFGLFLAASVASPSAAQFLDRTQALNLRKTGSSWGALFADLDGDTDLDLCAGRHQTTAVLFWNNGSSFSTSSQPWSGPKDRHGALILDLDGDEDAEIFVTHGGEAGTGSEPKELYRNDGNRNFESVAEAAGIDDPLGRSRSASAADFDGDGWVDIWVGKAPRVVSPNSIFKNQGGLSFMDVASAVGLAEELGTVGGIWGDLDGDLDPDLLVGGEEYWRPTNVFRNDGGTFGDMTSAFSPPLPVVSGADFGDFDNDGDLDLAVCDGEIGLFDTFAEGDSVRFFFNTRFAENGVDGLTVPATANTVYARLRLLGHDYEDMIFLGPDEVNPSSDIPIELTDAYVGQPTFDPGVDRGTWVWRDSPGGSWEIVCSTPSHNFDNFDGWLTQANPISGAVAHDLEESGFVPGGPRVWRNDGGTFVEITELLALPEMMNPRDISFVDYDNDGDLDLHVVDMGTSATPNAPDALFRNDGSTFTNVSALENILGGTIGLGDGATWGDADGDGDLDVFVQQGAGPLAFNDDAATLYLRNDGDPGSSLLLDLVGTLSGTAAIGARVEAHVGAMVVHRRVQANSWRGFGDPLRVHVGLAGAASADSVVVSWPSGVTEKYFGVAAGLWRVEEGAVATAAGENVSGSHSHSGSVPWRIDVRPQPAREMQSVVVSSSEPLAFQLSIHDATGRLVRLLHQGLLGPGERHVSWDGRGDDGKAVASGVYFLRVEGGDSLRMAKLVRVR